MAYDAKVYEQSTNLILKTAFLYYHKSIPQSDIAEMLGISVPTVSRLLKKARDQKVVRFMIPEYMTECLDLEMELKNRFQLKEVIIAPLSENHQKTPEELKKLVALEGARYVQRMVTPQDVLGVAWGETVWYLYNYLNPSQRVDMEFVTLHGFLRHDESKLDASWLVPRLAKAFGGRYFTIPCKGFQPKPENIRQVMQNDSVKKCFERFPYITMSVSGVGMFAPEKTSVLATGSYLDEETLKELDDAGVCGDLVFRFFGKEGKECNTGMRSRVVGIPWEIYRQIPTKIIVASGALKADVILSLFKGGLVDVLIIDQKLAQNVWNKVNEDSAAGT